MVGAIWMLRVSLQKGPLRAGRERKHAAASTTTVRPAKRMPNPQGRSRTAERMAGASYCTTLAFTQPDGACRIDERPGASDDGE
jgi:hypothetical protein